MTALEWRSRWARISASETGPVTGAPFSSTSTAAGSHDIAAGAGGVGGLDGVAGGAGDALVLKGAFFRHALRQVAGEQGDGVVAALAMAGELHAFLVDEGVDVLQIPGRAEAVGMRGLAPLAVGLLVAMAAVLGGVEAARIKELAVGGGGIGG